MSQPFFERLDGRMLLSSTDPFEGFRDRFRIPTFPMDPTPPVQQLNPVPDRGKIVLSGVEVRDGILIINGTHKNDVITVSRVADSEIEVVPEGVIGKTVVAFTKGWKAGPNGPIAIMQALESNVGRARGVAWEQIVIQVGDRFVDSEWAPDIQSIRINGGDGDDLIRVSKNLRMKTQILGGEGNDTLQAGSAKDVLRGGAGDDRLASAAGTFDHYSGGAGQDSLTGKVHLDSTHPAGDDAGIERFDQIILV